MYVEKEMKTPNGVIMVVVFLAALVAAVYATVTFIEARAVFPAVISIVVAIFVLFCACGLFVVNPNEGKVLQLFGNYAGTAKDAGLRWANPLYEKTTLSLRVRNFESGTLKVNDKNGNPIEIAAVIVWKVVDTAEAVFQVDSLKTFISVQSEAALRNLATSYAYENDNDDIALRSHTKDISNALRDEVQKRLQKVGAHVVESRITHLAYAPEIASAMLKRQQAAAMISARKNIVEGAVSMVEIALNQLAERQVVDLDTERKAAMVSNLLVVLCSDESASPVVNAGSLY